MFFICLRSKEQHRFINLFSFVKRDMSKIIFSRVMELGWAQWMFLHLMVSGTCSLVTVDQPPVLTTALGHDVAMPCQLNLNDEKMVTKPILYWEHVTQGIENLKVWPTSEKYVGRVNLLDNNVFSSNKTMLFKNVQWADSGKYLCKLSVTTERDQRFRIRGNGTLLMVYDTMIFNLSSLNGSLLWCGVNVTHDPGFVLSISYDGCKPESVDSAAGDNVADLPYVTLSETVSLRGEGKYECQLHLNKDLVTKSIFHYHRPVTRERGEVERNVSAVSEPAVVVFPEPWFLYGSLLLVPVTILLGLVVFMLMCRGC